MQLRPGEKLGRYEILRQIGQGGFSEVYLASDFALDRNVAIKVGREPSENDAKSPLWNEARILAQLQHPAILTILDVGRHQGSPYFVLEYMDGRTLRDLIAGEPPPETCERMTEVGIQVSEALDYVHRRGFLHRNIKPGVILLDSSGRAYISGFEVAIQTVEFATATVAGSIPYMAPEQVTNATDKLGPPTDIWGLGASLYHSLTGRLPFEGNSFTLTFNLIQTAAPTRPSQLNPGVPSELDRICLKCLEKQPENRYPNAAALATELRSLKRPRKELRVFISHSTQDREFVEREIINQLEANGIKTWYSKVDIQSSAEWERSILRGLDSCDWFLIVMSTRSAGSEWVKDELHWAIEKRPNKIIPVMIEECNLRDFHIRMARIQYVDFRNPSRESRGQLLELLTTDSA